MTNFLIIAPINCVTYKEVFPLIKENKMWAGINHIKDFVQPDKSIKSFGNIFWFTNMEHSRRNEPLELTKTYNPEEYPKYDNYDAIECNRCVNIPKDYDGVMGVPISYLDKHNPNQFEIVGAYNYSKDYNGNTWSAKINGKEIYKRVLIRKAKEN